MVIEDKDELLGGIIALLVNLALVLARQVFLHLLDATEGIGLISHHEVEESNWLVEELVVLEPRLVKEPLLPPVVPRSQHLRTTAT